jgi:hypothetical protein
MYTPKFTQIGIFGKKIYHLANPGSARFLTKNAALLRRRWFCGFFVKTVFPEKPVVHTITEFLKNRSRAKRSKPPGADFTNLHFACILRGKKYSQFFKK